ncbi:hypothetical protein LTR62_001081 [Meristemomyces frigidus]|uniref:Uncharacterized protein n=1 Tax=Meristemomyces frigidus TaxID=1508187 RepID=A0AAN7T9K8_9PEZI|nr:hypothetical protein LTR62_001081 [Meristemomyces frigidus]
MDDDPDLGQNQNLQVRFLNEYLNEHPLEFQRTHHTFGEQGDDVLGYQLAYGQYGVDGMGGSMFAPALTAGPPQQPSLKQNNFDFYDMVNMPPNGDEAAGSGDLPPNPYNYQASADQAPVFDPTHMLNNPRHHQQHDTAPLPTPNIDQYVIHTQNLMRQISDVPEPLVDAKLVGGDGNSDSGEPHTPTMPLGLVLPQGQNQIHGQVNHHVHPQARDQAFSQVHGMMPSQASASSSQQAVDPFLPAFNPSRHLQFVPGFRQHSRDSYHGQNIPGTRPSTPAPDTMDAGQPAFRRYGMADNLPPPYTSHADHMTGPAEALGYDSGPANLQNHQYVRAMPSQQVPMQQTQDFAVRHQYLNEHYYAQQQEQQHIQQYYAQHQALQQPYVRQPYTQHLASTQAYGSIPAYPVPRTPPMVDRLRGAPPLYPGFPASSAPTRASFHGVDAPLNSIERSVAHPAASAAQPQQFHYHTQLPIDNITTAALQRSENGDRTKQSKKTQAASQTGASRLLPVTSNDSQDALNAVPDMPMHQFVQHFANDYGPHFPDALQAFYRLSADVRINRISVTNYYASVYKVLHSMGAADLIVELYQFRPDRWFNVPMEWFHRAVTEEFDEGVRQNAQQRLQREGALRRSLGNYSQSGNIVPSSMIAGQATVVRSSSNRVMPTGEQTVAGQDPRGPFQTLLREGGRIAGMAAEAGLAARQASARDAAVSKDGHPAPEEAGAALNAKEATRKKRVPAKGFRAGGNGKQNVDSAMEEKDDDSEDDDEHDNEDDDDDDKDFRGSWSKATRKKAYTRDGRLKASYTKGADYPHVGDVYPTRRAILCREDKPYIHFACGQGFKHPDDVRKHHNNNKCAALKGKGKRNEEWNEHLSCAIMLGMLNSTMVADGFVLVDQESMDKVETAVACGRAFKAARAADIAKIAKAAKTAEGQAEGQAGGEAEVSGLQKTEQQSVHEQAKAVAKDGEAGGSKVVDGDEESVLKAVDAPPVKPTKTTTPKKPTPKKTQTPKKSVPAKRGAATAGDSGDEVEHGSGGKKPSKVGRNIVTAGPD